MPFRPINVEDNVDQTDTSQSPISQPSTPGGFRPINIQEDPVTPPTPEKSTLRKIGDFFTSSEQGFGNTIGTAIATLTPEYRKNQEAIAQNELEGIKTQSKIIAKLHDPSTTPEVKKHIMQYLIQSSKQTQVDLAKEIPALQKSAKQIFGEAFGTGLDVATVGIGSKLAGTGAKVATKVGEEVVSNTAKKTALETFKNVGKRYISYAADGAKYGGAYGLSFGAQEDHDNEQILKDIGNGIATGAIFSVGVPALLEGSVKAFKNVASIFSGVPKEAIERAIANPKQVGAAIKDYSKNPHYQQEILGKVQDSFNSVVEARNTKYQEALKGLENDIHITKTGPNEGTIYVRNPETNVFEPTKFTTKGLKDTFTKTLKEFKIDKDAAAEGGYNFERSPIKDSEKADLLELNQRIYKWNDITPTGLNDLRQIIDAYKDRSKGKRYNAIVGKLRENLSSYVNERVPQIGQMNDAYHNASAFLDKFKREVFSPNAKDQTKINTLLNIFKPNSQERKLIVEELGQKAGNDLLNEIAGSAMTDWLPKNAVIKLLSSIGVSGAAAGAGGLLQNAGAAVITAGTGAAVSSPKLVGKIATGIGNVSKVVPEIFRAEVPSVVQKKTSEIGNKIIDKMQKLPMGLSIEDISKLTPEERVAKGYNYGFFPETASKKISKYKSAEEINMFRSYEKEAFIEQGIDIKKKQFTIEKVKPNDVLDILTSQDKKDVLSKIDRPTSKTSTSVPLLIKTKKGYRIIDGSHALAGSLKENKTIAIAKSKILHK